MIRWTVPVALAVVLSGCASFDVGRYGVAVDNAVTLRKLGPSQVNVGPFTAAEPGRTEIGCRAVGPITTTDKRPFEDAIRQALVDELTVAEMLSASSPVTLTGRVDRLDFDSMAGTWNLGLTVTSSNGRAHGEIVHARRAGAHRHPRPSPGLPAALAVSPGTRAATSRGR